MSRRSSRTQIVQKETQDKPTEPLGFLGVPILNGQHSPQNVSIITYLLGLLVGWFLLSRITLLDYISQVCLYVVLDYVAIGIREEAHDLSQFVPKYSVLIGCGLLESIMWSLVGFHQIYTFLKPVGYLLVLWRFVTLVGPFMRYQTVLDWIQVSRQYIDNPEFGSLKLWLMGLQLLHGNWLTLVTVYLAVQSTERYSPPEISPSRLGLGFLNLKWFNGQHTQQNIALYSSGLGLLSGFGLSLFQTRYPGFGYYFFLLGFFHTFEYISTVMFKADAGLHSFLLNHSPEYHTAMIATLVEYLCELYLFPSLKQLNFFFFFLLSFGGQLMRTSAMWTAGVSFDHHVQYEKKSDHTLVTNGIYQYLRHPSYTGFYYWATFLQIALGNPICFVAFCYVLYKYFEDRIEEEEQMLIQFFGDDYVQYKKRSFVLIPGIP